MTQLGYPIIDHPHLADLTVYDYQDLRPFLPAGVDGDALVFDPSFDQALLDWAATTADRVIIVDGEWDPWSGGAVTLADRQGRAPLRRRRTAPTARRSRRCPRPSAPTRWARLARVDRRHRAAATAVLHALRSRHRAPAQRARAGPGGAVGLVGGMDDAAATRLGALADDLAEIFEVALAVDPPGELPPAWRQVLDCYAVMPLGEARRSNLAAEAGHARGAPVAEVEGCVRAAIARFVAAAVDAGAARGRSSSPRPGCGARPSRGTRPMRRFAAASSSTRRRPARAATALPAGYVARCAACGGPRLTRSGRARSAAREPTT